MYEAIHLFTTDPQALTRPNTGICTTIQPCNTTQKRHLLLKPVCQLVSNSMIVLLKQGSGRLQRLPPKCHLKNHPKDILRDKNHLYRTVLFHLTSNVAFKTRKIFRWLDIEFLKYLKFHLTASLPAHICKPGVQMKHRTASILQHNNKLISEMCLLGFR